MSTYLVDIEERYSKVIEVEAENSTEAQEIAERLHLAGDVIIDLQDNPEFRYRSLGLKEE